MEPREPASPLSHRERLRNRWRQLPPAARLLLATLALGLLLWALRPSAPERQVDDPHARVFYETARIGSFRPELHLFGRVESPETATLTASFTGELGSVPARAGHHVERGELLMEVDPQEAELLLTQREAELEQALAQRDSARQRHRSDRKNLELEQELVDTAVQRMQRLERLRGNDMASQSQLDDARDALARARLALNSRELAVLDQEQEMRRLEARIRQARAARDQAALDRARTRVEAPFDGRVSRVHVAAGERVRPGEPLVTLYDSRGMEVRAQIPSRYLPGVRQGLAGEARLTARARMEDEQLELELLRLDGEVGRGRGGVDALFRILEPTLLPEPGRTLELALRLPARDDLVALPPTALYGLERLYRIDEDNRLEGIRAERAGEWLDPERQSRLLFHSPALRSGDRLLTMQLPGAIDGLRVAPQQQGMTPLPGKRNGPDE